MVPHQELWWSPCPCLVPPSKCNSQTLLPCTGVTIFYWVKCHGFVLLFKPWSYYSLMYIGWFLELWSGNDDNWHYELHANPKFLLLFNQSDYMSNSYQTPSNIVYTYWLFSSHRLRNELISFLTRFYFQWGKFPFYILECRYTIEQVWNIKRINVI